MSYHFKNLVFEGGGVKGIAYLGAMRELEVRGININTIERVGGTSAGAINAILFACGYTVPQMKQELDKKDFNDFKDNPGWIFSDGKRILRKYGWNQGDEFKDWIGELIKAKTGSASITFKQLKDSGAPDLYLIATNLSTGFSEKFSFEHTPDIEIRDAVSMSMAIPLFFTDLKHKRHRNNPDNKQCIYVDGGVLMNYPIKLFDRKMYIAQNQRGAHALTRSYYDDGPNKRIQKTVQKNVYNK